MLSRAGIVCNQGGGVTREGHLGAIIIIVVPCNHGGHPVLFS